MKGTKLDKGAYLDRLKSEPPERQIQMIERNLRSALFSCYNPGRYLASGAGFVAQPEVASSDCDFRLDFYRRVRLELHGSKVSSVGGLLLFRELHETLGPHDLGAHSIQETPCRQNAARQVCLAKVKTSPNAHQSYSSAHQPT